MSSNRKRTNSRGGSKTPRAKSPRTVAIPIIVSSVGLALIVSFSGVFNQPALPPGKSPAPATNHFQPIVAAIPANPAPPPKDPSQGTSLEDLMNSDTPADLLNRGTELFQQGNYQAAATNYATAVEQSPDDETAHFNLASALAKLGKTAEARAEYLEALRLFPDYPEAHNNLGNLLASLGQLPEAAEHLQTALKLNPDSASANNNLGTVLVRLGKVSEATQRFTEAVRLSPDYLEARCNLGHTYFSLGKIAEAQAEFQAVLKTNPDFEPARRGLARISQLQATPSPVPPVPLR